MVTIYQTIVAMLVLQIYVSAAPSNTPSVEEIAKIEKEEPKLDTHSPPLEEIKDKNSSTENQRHKRFYNHYGFGFPPINPLQYPTYNKRDQTSELGVYGIDDPLSQIHRRLQDIASIVRQPPPPQPSHFPIYFPVLFIPQFGCACNPASDTKPQVTAKPDTARPTDKPPVDGSTTSPDVINRWPEMDDERQNWGLVFNETEVDYDDGQDFSRPISFDPILPSSATSRPAPPVEHGSSQGGAQNGGQSTTTVKPRPSSNDSSGEPGNGLPRPPAVAAEAGSVEAAQNPYPPSSAESPREAPTTCDGAVLSCCHQPQVTYDCFSILGCPDPTAYGNPCDPLVILRVIGKYQKFYGVRNG